MLLVFLFLLIFIIFIILGIIFSKIEIDGSFEFDNLHNNMINNIDSTNYINNDSNKYSNKEIKNDNKKTNSLNYQVYINMYLYKSKYFRLMRLKINSEYLKLYKYKIKTKKVYIDILKKVDMNKIIMLDDINEMINNILNTSDGDVFLLDNFSLLKNTVEGYLEMRKDD